MIKVLRKYVITNITPNMKFPIEINKIEKILFHALKQGDILIPQECKCEDFVLFFKQEVPKMINLNRHHNQQLI